MDGADQLHFFLIMEQEGLGEDIDGILGMSRHQNTEWDHYFVKKM